MKESDNMNYQENKLRKHLNNLPKVNAPDGFEEKLYARIERGDLETEYTESSSNLWIAIASSAAGLAIAFYSFGFFSTPSPTLPQNSLVDETPVIEKQLEDDPTDSLKTAPKSFDKGVIFVKDKK